MSFSVKSSRSALIKIIRDILIDDLSKLKDGAGDYTDMASVIKYRSSGNTPDYPYVTVNYDRVNTPQDAIVNTSYNEDQDRTDYVQFKEALITFKAYGEDSVDILDKFKQMMHIPIYKDRIKSEAGLSISQLQDVIDTPALHATQWVEGATFRCTFYTTSTFHDTNNEDQYFDEVNSSGDIDGREVLISNN